MRRDRILARIAALVLALALTPAAAAQPHSSDETFRESYQVRGALGDIPTTDGVEPNGAWNVEETLRFVVAQDQEMNVSFTLPAGSTFVEATCTCADAAAAWDGVRATFRVDEAGNHTLVFRHRTPLLSSDGFVFVLPSIPPERAANALLVFYLPDRFSLSGPIQPSFELPSTSGNPGLTIRGYEGTASTPLPATLAFTAVNNPIGELTTTTSPDTTATAAVAPVGAASRAAWTSLVLVSAACLVAGALLGLVAARRWMTRPASGPAPPPEILSARKHALVAALQALEAAHQRGDVTETAYQRVHADLKRDALQVMQSLAARELDAPSDPRP